MAIVTGTRLGPYEVLAPLGAGGMGEVYRARDTKLHREVAIKVLPELFAADPERLARFEREAQALAALNHPNIAQVFAVLESPPALAMELVDGEDLSQRLARGAIPLGEAMPIARQIADALEAAHERGIVHRDLKPANIKVREDGAVKVLDFGLAKAIAPSSVVQGFSPADTGSPKGLRYDQSSPTFTSPAMTGLGVILGTAAYMSPEQAKGKAVDKRADIWAFGAVLYEMLTGRAPFAGETTTEVLGAVVLKDPEWTLLPAATPVRIHDLLRRCLEKDPKRRLRDIADAAYELDRTEPSGTKPDQPHRQSRLSTLALVGAAILTTAATTWLVVRPRQAEPKSPWRFAVSGLSPLLFDAFQTLALSPDGSTLAFRGRGTDGVERIYVRDFHSLELQPLAGTDGARMPFFSPDGQWIGFFSGNSLKKIPVGGGPAQSLAPASNAGGGAWLDDGTIVFVGNPEAGLERVQSTGGQVETLMKGSGEARQTFASPFALPGSKAVLLLKRDALTFNLVSYTFGEKDVRLLVQDAYSPTWVSTGHLLFHKGDAILAVRFDPPTLTVSGSPFPVVQGVGNRLSYQSRLFSVSRDGTLVYVPAAGPGETGWSMVFVDRGGKETTIGALDRQGDTPRLSPDGGRVAFRTPAPNCDIWVRDLTRGTTVRLTKEGDNHGVVWRPDGSKVISGRISRDGTEVIALAADGAGTAEVLFKMPGGIDRLPTSWVDGSNALLVQDRFSSDSGTDVTMVPAGGGQSTPLLRTPADEGGAVVSHDGQLLAYVSDESGRNEIYVRAYSGAGPRLLVSTNGGIEPVWARKGDELFYRTGRDILAVRIRRAPPVTALDAPKVIFSGDYPVGPQVANYDVSADGRFLMMKGRQWPEGQVIIVQNWFTDMRNKAR